jgi:hypothetical protein
VTRASRFLIGLVTRLATQWRRTSLHARLPSLHEPCVASSRFSSVMPSAWDELLATVDVIGGTGEGGIRHQVDGERGDIG